MERSDGGPWRSDRGPELPTLGEVVRRQAGDLAVRAEAARYERSDGERVVEVRTERIGDAPLRMIAVTVLDVSAVASAARGAEAARAAANIEALREASRLKDEFLGVVSHELRNPLAAIRNGVYVLGRAAPDGEEARRAREILERQVAHLARLVDDLLDVTRIERGRLELRRAVVDLAALARRIAEDQQEPARRRGLVLDVQGPPGPVPVAGDEVRLGQVVWNLLHNATKFTARGGHVAVAVGTEGDSAELRVRDTGSGIAREVLAHLFEPFAQAAQPLARTEGGLGLGLALVKGIVELHGGTVEARSAGVGLGSEFVVRLPRAHGPRAPTEVAPAPRAAAPRRVLVVEDNPDAAASLAALLEAKGHVVEVAADGPSAVRRAHATSPEVVLCDIGLPGMNGYEVARALRATGAERMRLVALTGYARPDDVRRALEAGFDAHVAKPCDPERIDALLQ